MEMIHHFSHQHPLVLVDQELGDHGSRKAFCSGCNSEVKGYCEDCEKAVDQGYCSGCEEALEGSSYGCGQCGFFLHKKCVELQREIINHPFHPHHPLILRLEGNANNYCNICDKRIRFFYRCNSCDFDLDIRCAMHPQFVAQEFQKHQHFSHYHPLIFVEDIEIQTKEKVCSGCWEPMYKSSPFYCCPNCMFFLHKKCAEAELPLEINHPAHRKHPLMLSTKPPPHQEECSCHLCNKSYKGFVYYCSVCEVGFKAADAFLQTITAGIHEHPLTPISGTISFVCNACGTDGSNVCFTCAECNFIIHTDCTSLRCTIKITRHPHQLSHIYFFQDKEAGKRECSICHDEVNMEYGSYCCSDCHYFAHVNCAIDEYLLEDEDENEKSKLSDDLTAPAFQEIKPGEIKHFSHKHNLILSDHGIEDGQSCEGCMRSISTSFYYCAQFFLCKCCVHELPKEVRHWTCMHFRELLFYSIFYCDYCRFWSSGFGYNCNACDKIMCIRCHEFLDTCNAYIEGHEHSLFFDHKYKGNCCGCDLISVQDTFRCKDKKCTFALDYRCLVLPKTARYKYDNHALKLTFRDDHDLSQRYCDICEEDRDPKHWFYHCADCHVSAHPDCVLWKSPFVKLEKPFRIDVHEHLVTLVKIDFYPPKCNECGKPCRDDLAIQCTEPDCTYIFHWECFRWIYGMYRRYVLHKE